MHDTRRPEDRAGVGVRARGACCLLVATLAALSTAAGAVPGGTPVLFGFDADGSARQQALEQRFDAELDPADLRAWLKNLASEANQVGSPHDKANAELVRDQFRQWGWDAQIEEFDVLYPTPKHHTLELVAPTKFTASLTEPPIAGDADLGAHRRRCRPTTSTAPTAT